MQGCLLNKSVEVSIFVKQPSINGVGNLAGWMFGNCKDSKNSKKRTINSNKSMPVWPWTMNFFER